MRRVFFFQGHFDATKASEINKGSVLFIVINYVSPDMVAVELCSERAIGIMNWKPEEDTLCKLFCSSMRAPGGLCMKIYIFCWYHRLHTDGIFPGLEFKALFSRLQWKNLLEWSTMCLH